ncbi:MAG TPA: ribonuclease HII [Chloroflexi bacterium]|nr:ribonuclease HII [Chloroflexota bacterium]
MSHQPGLEEENRLWAHGYSRIAGVDEAGRGAWAGPVVAAAVILPQNEGILKDALADVRDSKLLSPRRREACYEKIHRHAIAWGVGVIEAHVIDRIGIVPATRAAMEAALRNLTAPADFLILDALTLPDIPLPQRAIIRGDRYSLSIAAASIIAKVTRDRIMIDLEDELPGYGFSRHKGYGTAEHWEALCTLGAAPCHRYSFAPIRALCDGQPPDRDGDGGQSATRGER